MLCNEVPHKLGFSEQICPKNPAVQHTKSMHVMSISVFDLSSRQSKCSVKGLKLVNLKHKSLVYLKSFKKLMMMGW